MEGWVERFAKPIRQCVPVVMGFAALYPSYGLIQGFADLVSQHRNVYPYRACVAADTPSNITTS
jgi:hypothetical protein